MPLMTWDAKLDVGVNAMNDEHREILACMNQIFDAHAKGVQGAQINALVAKLGDICVRHFKDEEGFMASIAFPGLGVHKILHQKLLDRYAELAAKIKADGGAAMDEFFNFLVFWLSSHIQGIDVKYGEHHRGANKGKAA